MPRKVLPRDEDRFVVRVEADGAAGPERGRREREDSGTGPDIQHIGVFERLLLEALEGQARGFVAAGSERRRSGEEEADPAGRRGRERRFSRVEPETPADGKGAGRRAKDRQGIFFDDVRVEAPGDSRAGKGLARPAASEAS
jgi:hypothetical protein